jgi:aminoglycoside/choline kinase family phosphotransferase
MNASIIVQYPRQLTLAWAQRVIQQHDPNARVFQVSLSAIDIGTTTRVKLSVEHDAPQLPRRWFVKLPSLNWHARLITALPRLLRTEVRFYQQLAHALPMPLAPCLAAHSQIGRGSILVLGDVSETGALAGSSADTLNLAQASAVISQLAQLHAQFWQKAQHLTWLASSVRRLEDALGALLAVPLMQRGLRLASASVPAHLHAPALRYAKQREKVMRFLHNAPQTLVHHDCHAGNLFWQGGQVGFLDWQLLRLGEGIGDVAYFLATALPPELRQQHEQQLIAHYANSLASYGISVDSQPLIVRYRAHLSYALEAMLITLAVGGMMNEAHNIELIRRAALAVDEQAAYAALPL